MKVILEAEYATGVLRGVLDTATETDKQFLDIFLSELSSGKISDLVLADGFNLNTLTLLVDKVTLTFDRSDND